MLIDCTTCIARDLACGDCVVTVLLASPAPPVTLDDGEQAALGTLARAGLVPPLRLVRATASRPEPPPHDSSGFSDTA